MKMSMIPIKGVQVLLHDSLLNWAREGLFLLFGDVFFHCVSHVCLIWTPPSTTMSLRNGQEIANGIRAAGLKREDVG